MSTSHTRYDGTTHVKLDDGDLPRFPRDVARIVILGFIDEDKDDVSSNVIVEGEEVLLVLRPLGRFSETEVWDKMTAQMHLSAPHTINFCKSRTVVSRSVAGGEEEYGFMLVDTGDPVPATVPHKCGCDRHTLFHFGCKCGGI